jgi:hypothetical protein
MAQLLLAAAGVAVHLGWAGLSAILHPAPGSEAWEAQQAWRKQRAESAARKAEARKAKDAARASSEAAARARAAARAKADAGRAKEAAQSASAVADKGGDAEKEAAATARRAAEAAQRAAADAAAAKAAKEAARAAAKAKQQADAAGKAAAAASAAAAARKATTKNASSAVTLVSAGAQAALQQLTALASALKAHPAAPATLAVATMLLLLRRHAARANGGSKLGAGSCSDEHGSSSVLSDCAIDALIALLLAERRTPAEDARLEALLLLLSQTQAPKGASSALPGGASDDPGAWRLVWTQKPLFWRGLAPLLQAQAEPALPGKQGSPRGQQPGQSFCTAGATMTSSVAAGPLRLTARGSFAPAKGSGALGDKQPVFHADVGGGDLQLALGPLGTLQLPLLLRGGGAWTLVYCDKRLRIFSSLDAGLAVQMPAAALPADGAA